MTKAVLLYAVALMMGLSAFNIRADNISFGANESPPYWSENMPFNGMGGEIMHTLSRIVGLGIRINFQPLQRLIDNDHNNDLGDPSFYIKNQDFSVIIPIAISQSSFHYYRPNHQHDLYIDSWDDLSGLKVGILKGGLEQREFFNELGIQFEESYKQESLIKKLRLGRLDVVIELDLVAKQLIDRLFPEDVDDFQLITISDSATPIAMMIDANYPNAHQLGEQYRKALAEIVEKGIYHDIVEKYYGAGKIPDDWFIRMDKYQRIYRFIEVE